MEVRTGTAEHAVDGGRVTLLGAVRTVTGAMTRVELDGARLLVDAGIAQGAEARDWRLPDEALDVDAVILTHAHNDHVGSLPALLERGFEGPLFGTRPTLEIARVVLLDSMRLNDLPSSERARVIERFDRQRRVVPYDHVGPALDGRGPSFAFREAGHILGSASVELRGARARVVISGDLGRPDSPILRDYHEAWTDARRSISRSSSRPTAIATTAALTTTCARISSASCSARSSGAATCSCRPSRSGARRRFSITSTRSSRPSASR